MNERFNDLMQKEMSRQEFLKTVGIGTAVIFGFSSLLRLLGVNHSSLGRNSSGRGFGGGPYGI